MSRHLTQPRPQVPHPGFERGNAPSREGVLREGGALPQAAGGFPSTTPTPTNTSATSASPAPMRIGAQVRDRLLFTTAGLSADEARAAFAPPRTLGAPEELQLAMDGHLEECGVYNLLQHALDLGLGAAEIAPQFPGYAYLSGLAQNPLIRAGVETTADEMTRRWIRLARHGGGEPAAGRAAALDTMLDARLDTMLDAFDLQGLCNRAAALCDYFGGCLVYIDTGEYDAEILRAPLMLDPATFPKGSLRGFTLVEPLNVYPGPYNARDPLRADYFAPTAWWVAGRLIHASRFLYFTANETPLLLRPAYNFFGIPTAQLALDYVGHFTQNRECASRLLNKFSLTALKTNMSGILQGGAADDLDARMAYFVQKQSNDGCFVLDKDSEDLVKLETPLAGVTDIVRQSLEFVAAIFRLPVTKFLGLSPAGFNPTGEAERRNLYDYLASRQEKVLRAPLQHALEVLQMNAFGRVDPGLTFEFVGLNPEDDGGGDGGDGDDGNGNKGNNGKRSLGSACGENSAGRAGTPGSGGPAPANMALALGADDKNDFKESEHPRDKDGKFSAGPGGGGGSATTATTAPAAGEGGEGEETLLSPAAPPPGRFETGTQPQSGGEAKSEEALPKDLSTKEGTRGGLGAEHDYSKDSQKTYKFFDTKLIDMDGFLNWEEKSTKGWKHSEYREIAKTLLDEALPEKFSKKIGGHKTLREFFRAASLSDEEMEAACLGMIYMESNGDPECKNSITSASGLMQVTRAAAKEVEVSYDELSIPKQGIQAGLRYLAYSMQRTSANGKNYDLARGVAGYVAGSGKAKGNIPKDNDVTREVMVVMSVSGRLEELRGRLDHPYGDRLIDYALATPEERKALKAGMKN